MSTPATKDRKPKKMSPPILTRPFDPNAALAPGVAQRVQELAVRLADGLPMAFTLSEADASIPPHAATEVYLNRGLADALRAVEGRRKSQLGDAGALPVAMLRLLLQLEDADALRAEVELWKVTNTEWPVPLLVTAAPPDVAVRHAVQALGAWIMGVPGLDEADRTTLYERLSRMPLRTVTDTFHPARWNGDNKGHRNLADMAARALEGLELFPGRGPIRRVVSRELTSGRAELTTDPYVALGKGELPAAYVVRLRTKTYPGHPQPLLLLELSRRQWTDNVNTYHGKVTLHAFPQATPARPCPPVVQLEATPHAVRTATAGGDYLGLRKQYRTLPEQPFVDKRLDPRVVSHTPCPVLALVRQGRGVQGGATGALEVDRLVAFATASLALEARGLVPWRGLARVKEPGRKEGQEIEEPFKYLFADFEPTRKQLATGTGAKKIVEKRQEAEAWAAQERARIDAHYGGRYRLLLLHAPGHDNDAREAQHILETILQDHVEVHREVMPEHTSGPRAQLPGNTLMPAPRAELRVAAWTDFLRRPRPACDGVMLVVPKGDGDTANDPVNKRASKVAILRALGVHAQYLRPMEAADERVDGEVDKRAQRDRKRRFDFVRRATRAFQDLAWEAIGMLDPVEDDSGRLSSALGDADRGFVTALTVVSVNKSKKRKNKSSTVPCALRLDLATQRTEANLLLADGSSGWLNLRDATTRLLGNTRKMNFDDRKDAADRRATQDFFQSVLDDLNGRVSSRSPEVVVIDGDTVCPAWPGLYDKHLKLDDLRFEPGEPARSRLQLGWGDLTLVRLRAASDRSPKVLTLGEREVEVLGVRFPTPRWSESETFRLIGGGAPTYLNVGANNNQTVRGMSGHLAVHKHGKDKVTALEPWVKTYATPDPLEVNVLAPGHLPEEAVVHLLSKLRRRYAHYDGWTKLPAPMSFAHVVKDYIPDYDHDFQDGDDESVTESGSD
ncbi:RNaseH domain-containing protein [Deinococcus arcticus]|nr:RNaseH domain-containing protein [Deinococcus arcticus]